MPLIRGSGVLGGLGLVMLQGCGAPTNRVESVPPATGPAGVSVSQARSTSSLEPMPPQDGWVTLSNARTIEGVTFSPGSTLRFAEGRNDYFELGDDQILHGTLLPKGTRGIRDVSPSGNISAVRIPVDWPIQGYPFAKGLVQFLNNAKIGLLSKDVTSHGIRWKKGDMIRLDDDKADVAIRPSGERIIDGIPCAGGEWISFHSNNRLAGATLSRDHTIRGVRYSKRTTVSFDRYGNVLRHPGILDLMGVFGDRLAVTSWAPTGGCPWRREGP